METASAAEQHGTQASVRVIAFYLPQFHRIAENDAWWEPGFTEWTAVTRARPLFRGHAQPREPGELGYYDLRLPEIRARQAELALQAGIHGFCYWHYWLGDGRRLLERPFNEVLDSGQPDFPFCLGWANHDWRARFFGAGDRCLVEQKYSGPDDARAHFDYLLRAFSDPRYIRVDGKPLLYVFAPNRVPQTVGYFQCWRDWATAAGLPGLYLVAQGSNRQLIEQIGFDAFCPGSGPLAEERDRRNKRRAELAIRRILKRPLKIDYERIMENWPYQDACPGDVTPVIHCDWDVTPRYQEKGELLRGFTPERFRKHAESVLAPIVRNPAHPGIVFLKSWNEWAEGNYIEPDRARGYALLQAMAAALRSADTSAP